MNFYVLIALHFVADFLLQSREMGRKKSTDWRWLGLHLGIQFMVFLPYAGFQFAAMNALLHGIIDRNVWKLYKLSVLMRVSKDMREGLEGSWRYWDDHVFYSTIGFDQMLHMATLYMLMS